MQPNLRLQALMFVVVSLALSKCGATTVGKIVKHMLLLGKLWCCCCWERIELFEGFNPCLPGNKLFKACEFTTYSQPLLKLRGMQIFM
ncbi:hypothetical protein LOK49_LG02G01654 [Camellia lanceoleosa]|uniref:Uncharacterized protein n=1 Tax=Camellia lanceoleosa TaxID=1840588 RepID=A0ACC0IPN6_9ERIC|nr:hypothetical protein LOK49_LG02G01654 [Camellia lanceoleosa]